MSQKSWISDFVCGKFGQYLIRKLGQLILLAMSLLSCESFATQADALQLAISHPQVALTIPLISKVEVINIYHCPDCYDIRISGFDNTAQIEMSFRTRINSQNELEATLVDTKRVP